MKKAAIYARFSTDLQNERSIEDQVALCRNYAAREGMNVTEVYEDRARSGGSILGRDGLLRLMDRARDRSFEVIVVEALDRLRATWRTSRVFTKGCRFSVSKFGQFMKVW
jgi:site-specific DNA recombinase